MVVEDFLHQTVASYYDNEDLIALLLQDREHQDFDVRHHRIIVQQPLLPLPLLDSSSVKNRDDVEQCFRAVMDQMVILESLMVAEEHCLEVSDHQLIGIMDVKERVVSVEPSLIVHEDLTMRMVVEPMDEEVVVLYPKETVISEDVDLQI